MSAVSDGAMVVDAFVTDSALVGYDNMFLKRYSNHLQSIVFL